MEATVNTLSKEALQFLKQCEQSSQSTISAFESLLQLIESSVESNTAPVVLLNEFIRYVRDEFSLEEAMERFHFSVTDLNLDGTDSLTLLHFPSTFLPESWSFTFYEGLNRYRQAEFHQKKMVELGCGNGWITIALTKKYLPETMYGFDINPRAVLCAQVNSFINSYDAEGHRIEDQEGKTIAERTSFSTSDLLGHCINNNIKLDRIIGCIPQVLSPDPELTINLTQNEDDDFLLSLSNYCEKQGYVEDQFGLGLIAKTLEQSLEVLHPNGKLILNMGGRPGRQVLDRLFQRRGFGIKRIWNRMIEQAGDTEITPLVDIEKQSAHRFEFFMEPNGTVPISAKTAYLHAKNKGRIYHALTVVESEISYFSAVRKIFSLLNKEDFSMIKPALDLSFENHSIQEEKMSFLEFMAEHIVETDYFPYNPTEGENTLRSSICQFLNSYYHVPLKEDAFFVAPNTQVLVRNILHNYGPACALVDKHFCAHLPASWMEAIPGEEGISIVEAPTELNLVCKLIESIKPEFVVVRLTEEENKVLDSFMRLVTVSQQYNTRVVLDISNHFDLSSAPKKNAVFNYLSENELPLHVTVLCGLEKNQVYQDMELGFLISRNQDLLLNLANAAELTYSRTPVVPQLYYSKLIQDLLDFQMPSESENQVKQHIEAESSEMQGFCQVKLDVSQAFDHPSIQGNQLFLTPDTIRLDYGENELHTPTYLKAALFESFARQQLQPNEIDPRPELAQFVKQRFSYTCSPESVVLGNGVAPIFAAVLKYVKQSGMHLLFPRGTYGYFVATADYFQVPYSIIETEESQHFKVTENNLRAACSEPSTKYALFFNAPVVNPTGAIYQDEETRSILAFCKERGFLAILDSIFSGLEHVDSFCTYNFGKEITQNLDCILLGGVAKEYAAGGLRLGYAMASNKKLMQGLNQGIILRPHGTITYAFKKTLQAYLEKNTTLLAQLKTQKETLNNRYQALSSCLQQKGWEVLPASGGLFMVAKPTELIGKKVLHLGKEITLNSVNINEVLLSKIDILVNNSAWTEIPGYCRFVLSVEEKRFETALERLKSLAL